MLKMERAAPNQPAKAAPGAIRALRSELVEADDSQVLQIVALLDASPEPEITSALLDRLRPRLATLRPARKLRFDRLLFLPMDLLIVPATEWKPESQSIPRNAIASIAATVLKALGNEAAGIQAMIRDSKTDDAAVVEQAGAMLWPRAATLLAALPPPVGWAETGLRPVFYPQLASASAAILRMAIDLRTLVHDAGGVSQFQAEQRFAALVAGLAAECSMVQGMVLRLVMSQIPGAMPLLRRVTNGAKSSDKAALRAAMDLGLDAVLLDLEGEQGLTGDLRHSTLSASGAEAARLAAFLLDVEADPEAMRYRARLHPIRRRLDGICRSRLEQGIEKQILGPLNAAGFVLDTGAQKNLEASARDVRALELAGRRFGNATAYDAALAGTANGLRTICASGGLSTMRKLRLLEILLGPDAAEAEYRLEQTGAATPG